MNALRPGAYVSMTKVDFTALDSVLVKPQGIYGSRSEIIRFLQDIGAVDDLMYVFLSAGRCVLVLIVRCSASLLRNSRDDASTNKGRSLRSGLYMLRMEAQEVIYVIYWPEDSTWNDDASLAVQKNRVTFMR